MCKEQKSKLESNDTVSKAVFDQIKWERDVALRTLEEHGIGFAERATCSKMETVDTDLISRQAAIEAMAPFDTNHELRDTLEDLPPVEPERPKRTETMMVDGEPTEIDPLSYEVGYSHGQERPEGEWIFNPKDAIDLMFAKPKCNKCGFESADGGNFCPNCGADMRGDKE